MISSKKNTEKKGFSSLLLLLVVVATIIGGASYWYFKRVEKPANPSFSPTQGGTTNWKVYSNKKYGIEFKYPDRLALQEKEEISQVKNYTNLSIYFSDQNKPSFNFSAVPENPPLNYEGAIDSIKKSYQDVQMVKILDSPTLKFGN